MSHIPQERYSSMVLAKLRAECVLKDGVVFNNDYEGKPTAGAVKIPTRDEEVAVSAYDKANGIQATNGSTAYTTLTIDKDIAVNEIIDGYDAASVPDGIVAERLDSAGYSLAHQLDKDGATVLIAAAEKNEMGEITKDNVYSKIVRIRKIMNEKNIPAKGRYLLVTADAMECILNDEKHFVKASALGDEVVQTGAIGKIAGFLVLEWNDPTNTDGLLMLAGHPKFATRATEFAVPVKLQDLAGSGKYIGASAVQGRKVYGHKVTRSVAIQAVIGTVAE